MADYGVTYNGVSLQAAIPGAQVLDVVVQPMPIVCNTVDRPIANGCLFFGKRLTSRKVTITVELPFDTEVGAHAAMARQLRVWAEQSTEKALTLPDYAGKELLCVLTSMGDISIKDWHKPVELVFTAFNDPYFKSQAASTGAVGVAFSVEGDANAHPVITHVITDALVNPVWTLAPGYSIALLGSYASGTIVIDLEKRFVSHNGRSIMDDLSISSRFYEYSKSAPLTVDASPNNPYNRLAYNRLFGQNSNSYIISGPAGGIVSFFERWS